MGGFMITIFLIICMFFVGIWGLAVMSDLIQTVVAKFKKTDYSWQSPGIFTGAQSWVSALLMSAMLICGIYAFYVSAQDSIHAKYQSESIKCDRCQQMFPEEYETRDSWDTICPYCTNKEINEIIRLNVAVCSVCATQYDTKNGKYGMCWDCFLDETAECVWCGSPAHPNLLMDNDEAICVTCASEILNDKQVAKAVWKYIEG